MSLLKHTNVLYVLFFIVCVIYAVKTPRMEDESEHETLVYL